MLWILLAEMQKWFDQNHTRRSAKPISQASAASMRALASSRYSCRPGLGMTSAAILAAFAGSGSGDASAMAGSTARLASSARAMVMARARRSALASATSRNACALVGNDAAAILPASRLSSSASRAPRGSEAMAAMEPSRGPKPKRLSANTAMALADVAMSDNPVKYRPLRRQSDPIATPDHSPPRRRGHDQLRSHVADQGPLGQQRKSGRHDDRRGQARHLGLPRKALQPQEQRQQQADDQQLAGLDAEIKPDQSRHQPAGRQTDFGQRAGEAEAMHQAEQEAHQPAPRYRPLHGEVLEGNVSDRQGDHRLDQLRRQGGDAEHRQRQGQAMRHREGGDERGQRQPPASRQNQGDDEQHMIEAGEDVLDADEKIGRERIPRRAVGWRRAGDAHIGRAVPGLEHHLLAAAGPPDIGDGVMVFAEYGGETIADRQDADRGGTGIKHHDFDVGGA